jgi:hypothetical protein
MTPEHRAAISLNNTGVTLLQRRCHRQGIATLRDAVVAMSSASRRILDQQEECPNDGVHSSTETPCMNVMVQQAAKRLAKPEPSVDRNTVSQYALQVLSGCENPSGLQEYPHHNLFTSTPTPTSTTPSPTAPSTGFNNNRAFLLRIEALNYEASTEHNFDHQASIILQNFGVANRVMASLTNDLRSKHDIHVVAMRVFTSSYSMLTNNCESDDTMEETELEHFFLTATSILQNLVELSTLLGLHQYGQEYSSRLEDMRNSARDMLQDWSFEGLAARAA